MNAPPIKLALVVATKDRPEDLRKTLASIEAQTRRPHQIVIVDASNGHLEHVAPSSETLNITYVRHWPPSAAAQRNAGILRVGDDVNLIGFMDDDIIFQPDAIEKMLAFWHEASAEVGGAAFNLLNPASRSLVWLKNLPWVSRTGLYTSRVGGVAPSGWQNITGTVSQDTRVQWLSTCAVVWRRAVIDDRQFDPYFTGYSYLEDVDFSYAAAKDCELVILGDAGYRHYPSPHGRIGLYTFGRREVEHRLYFVRKHGLSTLRCYGALLIRSAMTLATAIGTLSRPALHRAAGNLVEFVKSVACRRTYGNRGSGQ